MFISREVSLGGRGPMAATAFENRNSPPLQDETVIFSFFSNVIDYLALQSVEVSKHRRKLIGRTSSTRQAIGE
jgi:hypothetical protein